MTQKTLCSNCNTPLTRVSDGLHCLSCNQSFHSDSDNQITDQVSYAKNTTHVLSIKQNTAASVGIKKMLVPQIQPHKVAQEKDNTIHYRKLTTAERIAKQPKPTRNQSNSMHLIGPAIASVAVVGFVVFFGANSPAKKGNQAPPTQSAAQLNPVTKTSQDALKRDEVRKQNLSEIATALNVYHDQTGRYPVGNDISSLYFLQYSNPSYISRIEYDPASDTANGKVIKYMYESDGKTFALRAKLENPNDSQQMNGFYQITD